jgi:nucleotide-binding universal stress UspA family protein
VFNVIVVGADDSPTARRAIEAAAELTIMSAGTLHIVLRTVGKRRGCPPTRRQSSDTWTQAMK